MRVTEMMRYQSMTRVMTSLASRQAKAAHQALTGQRLESPSDDPMAAAQLVRLRSQKQEMTDYRTGISTTKGDIDFAESTLAQGTDLLVRAKELALAGSNSTLPDDGRAALAQEVNSLREELMRLANTQGSRGYLFAGTNTTTSPFDIDGNYSGNDQSQQIEVGRGVTVNITPSGLNAFNPAGGENTFALLRDLSDALSANDADAVRGTLERLDTAHLQMTTERSRVGLTIERLNVADSALSFAEDGIDKQSHELGAADPFEAYSSATTLAQALERAVAVSQQILNLGSLSRL
jgi:flagellar hook-associated protein 3 FlgL